MILKLVLVSQAECDSKELILKDGSYGVGRNPNNELRIQEGCVSGYHAEFHPTPDGGYEVKDLDSSNGTYLNRKRILSPVKIKAGDFLKFGIIKVVVEAHGGVAPPPKSSPNSKDAPRRILSLKDRFTKAKQRKEETAQDPGEEGEDETSWEPAVSKLTESGSGNHAEEKSDKDKISFCEEESLIDESQHDLREMLDDLKASKNAAEEVARSLREELSRLREESRGKIADNEKSLSFQITELESSLTGEKLLNDAVKAKNEQFRSEIQTLTLELGNAQEEASRLKAINARQFTLPDDLSSKGAEFAKLKEELAFSFDDKADLQAEITVLKGELAKRELELTERQQEGVRAENSQVSQLQQEIQELKARLSESESFSENFIDEKVDLIQAQEELQRKLETAEEATHEAVKRGASLQQINVKLTQKVKEAEGQKSALEARNEESASSDAKNLKLIKQLKKQLKDSESHSEAQGNLQEELESTQQRQLVAETEVEQLKEKLASMEAEAQQVREQLVVSEEQRSNIDVLLSAKSSLASEQAATIEQLRTALTETTESVVTSKSQLVETHQGELKALQVKLQSSHEESEKLKKQLKGLRSELASLQNNNAKEQTQQDREREAKLSQLEKDLAKSNQLRDEIESAREELKEQLRERDERIASLQNNNSKEQTQQNLEQAAKFSQLEKDLAKSNQLRDEIESAREELKEQLRERDESIASLQNNNSKEQTQQDREREAKLSQLEKDLAKSIQLREEIESAQEELKEQLRERDERIASLIESSQDSEAGTEGLEEEKSHLASKLELTKEGLSGVLHSTRARLVQKTQELEAEILRRDKVEKQLRKSQVARKGLLDEVEALRAESDEELALSPEDTSLDVIGDLKEEKSEELLAFEARLESLRSDEDTDSYGKREFSEEEFYQHLVEKLDLVAALIKQHENKWGCAKIVKQLAPINKAFLELLEGQNTDSEGRRKFSEEEFYLQLVEKLDLVAALIKRFENKSRCAEIVKQLAQFNQALLELMADQSVKQIHLPPGTPLGMNQSNRLELVPHADGTQPKIKPFGKSEVAETVCPGYIFRDGTREVVIRKARVVVS